MVANLVDVRDARASRLEFLEDVRLPAFNRDITPPQVGRTYDVIIVGAGAGGLALANQLRDRGLSVCVVEQGRRYPDGGSLDNFGQIALPDVKPELFSQAEHSREIYRQTFEEAGFRITPRHSVFVAQTESSAALARSFVREFGEEYGASLMSPAELARDVPLARNDLDGRLGIRFSKYDQIESREWHPAFLSFLVEQGIQVETNVTVTDITADGIVAGSRDQTRWEASAKYVLYVPGAFDGIFKDEFLGLMSRGEVMLNALDMADLSLPRALPADHPDVNSDLSGVHYDTFKGLPEYAAFRREVELAYPEQLKEGIHVLTSVRKSAGSIPSSRTRITIGDSHRLPAVGNLQNRDELAAAVEEFRRNRDTVSERCLRLIVEAGSKFLDWGRSWQEVSENLRRRWAGVYLKSTRGKRCVLTTPHGDESRVVAVRALGGLGNTWSHFLAETLVDRIFGPRTKR